MIAEHELRHGLEHRQLDRLAFAGAVAVKQRGEHDMRGIDADDAIRQRQRNVARLLSAGLRSGRRQRADALNEIVVSRLAA